MTRSQANRIEEIIRNQDVRSPRVTLDAVMAILDETPSIKPEQPDAEMDALVKRLLEVTEEAKKYEAGYAAHVEPDDVKNEFGNPVAVFRIYNSKEMVAHKLNVKVAIDYCDAHLEPRHFKAVKRTIKAFAKAKVERMRQEAGQ